MRKTFVILSTVLLLAGCGAQKNAVSSFTKVEDLSSDEKVSTGYGEVSKRESTTSISRVIANENEGLIYTDIYEYLEGKVPGVEVSPTKQIRVRGISSINSSNEPLFVVDGMTFEDPTMINPADIYTVDVLKDSATAIYGSRGATGVIVITTKAAAQQQILRDQEKARQKAAKKAAREAAKNKNR